MGFYCNLSFFFLFFKITLLRLYRDEKFFQLRPELSGLCAFFVLMVFVSLSVFIDVVAKQKLLMKGDGEHTALAVTVH